TANIVVESTAAAHASATSSVTVVDCPGASVTAPAQDWSCPAAAYASGGGADCVVAVMPAGSVSVMERLVSVAVPELVTRNVYVTVVPGSGEAGACDALTVRAATRAARTKLSAALTACATAQPS